MINVSAQVVKVKLLMSNGSLQNHIHDRYFSDL